MLRFLFSFHGRISRGQMWAFAIGATLFEFCLVFAVGWTGVPFQFFAVMWFSPVVLAMPGVFQGSSPPEIAAAAAGAVAWSVIVISELAVITKRLHDRCKRVWWIIPFWFAPMACAIPVTILQSWADNNPAFTIAASIVVVVFGGWGCLELFCFSGTPGDNRFGPDPLGGPVIHPFQGQKAV